MNKFLVLFVFVLLLCGCQVTDEGVLFKTADPRFQVGFRFPPTPVIEPEVVPEEEVGLPEPDPTPAPPCEIVKGNISRSGEKIYHVPGGANYDQVKIDEAAGEMFFCTEEEAIAAGWRKASR